MNGKRILEGLKDAVAYMDGSADKTQYNSHVVHAARTQELVDIKSIRQKMGLTQAGFAAIFGFSLYTGMGELGLSLKPSKTLPLSFDLGVQGYVGKREGVTGSLQVKFEF
jgi:hypothetical protein